MENTALYKSQKIENWIREQIRDVLTQSVEVLEKSDSIIRFTFDDYNPKRFLKGLMDVEVMAQAVDVSEEQTVDFYIFRALLRMTDDDTYDNEDTCKYYEKEISLRWISGDGDNGEKQVEKFGKVLYKFVRKIIERLVMGREPMMRHDKKLYHALVAQIIENRRMNFCSGHVDEEMI